MTTLYKITITIIIIGLSFAALDQGSYDVVGGYRESEIVADLQSSTLSS